MQVISITATDTHDLRRRVLRNGTLSDQVVFDGDDDAETFHLGMRDDAGLLVATSTWLVRPHSAEPDRPAHQLRGMATEPSLQGAGAGSQLLLAGLDRCARRGSELVWAHARSTAVAFYERHGFVVCGDEYVDVATGLPHIDVVTSLASREG